MRTSHGSPCGALLPRLLLFGGQRQQPPMKINKATLSTHRLPQRGHNYGQNQEVEKSKEVQIQWPVIPWSLEFTDLESIRSRRTRSWWSSGNLKERCTLALKNCVSRSHTKFCLRFSAHQQQCSEGCCCLGSHTIKAMSVLLLGLCLPLRLPLLSTYKKKCVVKMPRQGILDLFSCKTLHLWCPFSLSYSSVK